MTFCPISALSDVMSVKKMFLDVVATATLISRFSVLFSGDVNLCLGFSFELRHGWDDDVVHRRHDYDLLALL